MVLAALTVAAYDLLVRRTRVTRFLFGMRGQPDRPRRTARPRADVGARLPPTVAP
jgi:hypothetical protein